MKNIESVLTYLVAIQRKLRSVVSVFLCKVDKYSLCLKITNLERGDEWVTVMKQKIIL